MVILYVPIAIPLVQPAGIYTDLRLARNEEMDPCSSPYITHYSSFHFLFHPFIPSYSKVSEEQIDRLRLR